MIKYRLNILYLIPLLLFMNCGEKENSTAQADVYATTFDTITLPKLSGLKPKLRLTPEAQTATANWNFYQEISQIVDSLGIGTIGLTKKYLAQLDKTYLNVKESQEANVTVIPDELSSQAIQARLTALETQIRVLQNEVDKNELALDQIMATIVKSKNALQDLNLQIDERFALSIEEMLKAANEVPDSLSSAQSVNTVRPQLNQN